MTARYLLRTDNVRALLDAGHWSHHRAARHLGISPAYFSQLLNRHRALTADMRHLLLTSRLFEGVNEDVLWERVEDGGGAP